MKHVGAWAWRVYVRVPYWRFLRVGCRPTVGFDGETIREFTINDRVLSLVLAFVGAFVIGCLL